MNSSKYLLTSSREYAIYVCRNRAIPYVGDGLKHGQMIALWLLRHRADKLRTFALSGLMAFERLYVHGEVSANDAIGLLAAPFKNNVPLIEGLGHFGSRIAPDAVGAPRYTDVKRAKAAEMLLYKDLEIIPMEDNYDGSNEQPAHFLPLVPLVLLNGISGIAIGWSTNILPHDLKTLIEATKCALQEKPLPPLPPHFAKYDVGITSIGQNRWEFNGQAKVVDSVTIQITELPPGMDIEKFRKNLIAMEDAEQIQGFVDRSTETIDITVKMKRRSVLDGVEKKLSEWSEKDLIEFFRLRERVTERIVVINWKGDGMQTYESPEALVLDFAKWRLGWYTVRYEAWKVREAYEIKYWKALKMLFLDQFPKRLGGFENKAALQQDVLLTISKYDGELGLDDNQLDRVISLPTYRWTKDYEIEVDRRIDDLTEVLIGYDAILASPTMLRDIYLKELDDLKGTKP
jgi:DNA gyrase/topoisomerase IV subunit A